MMRVSNVFLIASLLNIKFNTKFNINLILYVIILNESNKLIPHILNYINFIYIKYIKFLIIES